jgi:hypothetical protein
MSSRGRTGWKPTVSYGQDEPHSRAVEWARQLSVHLTGGERSIGICLLFMVFQQYLDEDRGYRNESSKVDADRILRDIIDFDSGRLSKYKPQDDEVLIDAIVALHEKHRGGCYMPGIAAVLQVLQDADLMRDDLKRIQGKVKAQNRYQRRKQERKAAAGNVEHKAEAAAGPIILRRPGAEAQPERIILKRPS